MTKLFESTSIKDMTLANRFVRSATWEGMARDDGSCTPELTRMMVQLAQGGVGLIITGHAFIRREGKAGTLQLGVYDDTLLPGLTEMTEAVHKAGGKIVMQLSHAGNQTSSKLTGLDPLGPSVMEKGKGPFCREVSQGQIQEIIKAFEQGALRAKKAGFDGVQIHAAHGYLLSQFLSPYFNKRKDRYGGGIEKRTQIVLEVLSGIRAVAGEDFPVMIKMNSEDFVDGGFTVDEMLWTAAVLEQAGLDAIELSGGTPYSGQFRSIRKSMADSDEKEVYYLEAAKRYKERIGIPLMLVGGIRSFEVSEQLVNDGITDYISLCRPLIREPHLIKRWMSGDRAKSACLSDNLCFKPIIEGKGLNCVAKLRDQSGKK